MRPFHRFIASCPMQTFPSLGGSTMPTALAGAIRLYYEIRGQGYPLLLIRGFGSNADHWYSQVPAFSRAYRTIVFDNRGMARSEKPEGPWSISAMAADAAGLLDALDIPRAHVLGLSMGGMIAQRVAIDYPEKVRGLVLACTHCGGEHAFQAADEVKEKLRRYAVTGSPEAAIDAMSSLFSRHTLTHAHDLILEYARVSRGFPPDPAVLEAQLGAVMGHDAWAQLPEISAPTLVLTGDEDILIPPDNARILAERIPDARLRVIEGGAHQFVVEKADAFNAAVLAFLNGLDAAGT